jgi:hypothetical protein
MILVTNLASITRRRAGGACRVTPPRMPPSDDGKTYVAYAVTILSALAAEDGARERAAKRLGIPVRTLSRHIDQLGLGDLCAAEGQSAIWPLSRRQPKQPG